MANALIIGRSGSNIGSEEVGEGAAAAGRPFLPGAASLQNLPSRRRSAPPLAVNLLVTTLAPLALAAKPVTPLDWPRLRSKRHLRTDPPPNLLTTTLAPLALAPVQVAGDPRRKRRLKLRLPQRRIRISTLEAPPTASTPVQFIPADSPPLVDIDYRLKVDLAVPLSSATGHKKRKEANVDLTMAVELIALLKTLGEI